MSDQKPYTPTEIDDTEDRMGSMEPLDFDQRRDERKGRIGDQVPAEEIADQFPPEREAEAGMTVGEVPGGETTMDDLAPETQIPDDGSRSPRERGHGGPADQDLSVVSEHEIGADVDLDEAELGRYDPLDGKPWDAPPRATRTPASAVATRCCARTTVCCRTMNWRATPRWIQAGTSVRGSDRAACRTERGVGLAHKRTMPRKAAG